MENLLKTVVCGFGCTYLVMHVVCALTSAAERLRYRSAQGKPPIARCREYDATDEPDPAGTE